MEDISINRDTASLEDILQEANALLAEDGELPVLPEEAAVEDMSPDVREEDEAETQPEAVTGHTPWSLNRNDILITVLMGIACLLCLGIIGVLAYWLDILG